MLSIDIPGVQVFTRTFGLPTNPAVLCLHSLFLDGTMFEAWAEHVSDQLFVVAPDFRGQGSSPNRQTHPTLDMEIYAEDTTLLVDALTDRFGMQRFGILAQSMGGDVALRVAHASPDLVSAIALLGSSACAEPTEQLRDFRDWVQGVEQSGFTGETLQYTLEVMLGSSCRSDPTRSEIVQQMLASLAQLDQTLLPAMRGVVERSSVLADLPAIQVPTLIISGSEDWARPPQWSIDMHQLLPRSELVQLDGVGHSPILEAPDLVFDKLREFFLRNV